MDFFTLALVLLLTIFIYLIVFGSRNGSQTNSPPGPSPIPILGNLIYIARQHPVNYIALHKISKQYGNITRLWVGSDENILISKTEVAKEIYTRTDCLNRPVNGAIWERNLHQNIGLAFSVDEGWSNIRKFTSRAMREYGFGNRVAMEKLLNQELTHFVDFINQQIKEKKDGVLHFDRFFHISLLNVMTSLITGRRHDYTDKELRELAVASAEWFEVPVLGVLAVMAFPWTRYICPGLLGYTKQMNALGKMYSYARKILEKHRKQNTFLESTECFTDSFLKAAYENKNDPSSLFTDDQFAVLCTDLFQGGADTTSTWLGFAIIFLTLHPEVQDKLVKEIEDCIGFETAPALSHRDKMVYTQAVILEIHRFARLTVIMPPRRATEEFDYGNFRIKKGTTILVNLHSCYMDSDVWEDPDTFRPERFLNPDKTQLDNKTVDLMSIIFGAGRRICFGEPLARDSSFLYLTTLLQKFSFKCPPETYPTPDAEPHPGIILSPKPFYATVAKRHPLTST